MTNPYIGRPSYTFWKSAVSDATAEEFDPVVKAEFQIGRHDKICTAGSCFAQHISRHLSKSGYHYHVTEEFNPRLHVVDENFGVYPARTGNVYTTRQLLQLIARAYGLFSPTDDYWVGRDGQFIDPYRPTIRKEGFPTVEALQTDRKRHLAAVRAMFEECDVFIFTLGLTEYWRSSTDGAAFPMAPGLFSDAAGYEFHNANVTEIVDELKRFVDLFRKINPIAKILFTVSPVALVATYEDRHVLVSTTVSKSKLRAAVDEICCSTSGVTYFPSYEMITGQHSRGSFLAEDLREVRSEGVEYVMERFERHYLQEPQPTSLNQAVRSDASKVIPEAIDSLSRERSDALEKIVCDEEEIVAFRG